VPSGGIEQGQLLASIEQRLLLVLAVDFQQACAQRSQLRQGRGPAVDPGAGSAVGADDPPQLAVVALVQVVVAQPGQGGRRIVERETGGELGALGAVPDHAGVGACTGQRQQGIHQQGLAGAGFARDHGQAGPEVELRGVDDGKIADGEVAEHGRQFCLKAHRARRDCRGLLASPPRRPYLWTHGPTP